MLHVKLSWDAAFMQAVLANDETSWVLLLSWQRGLHSPEGDTHARDLLLQTPNVPWSMYERVGHTVSPAKRLNRSRCHLGCRLVWAQRTTYYMEMYISTTWRIRLNNSCSVAMRPSLCQITLTICSSSQNHNVLRWLYTAPDLITRRQTHRQSC